MPGEQKKTKLTKLDKILKQVKLEDELNDLILAEIEAVGQTVHKNLEKGDIDISKREDGHTLAAKEIKKFKVQTKKFELEQQLKLMLHDNVISKKDFDEKMDLIKKNIEWIEEAVDDDQKMKELQFKLGIVHEVLPEVVLMSDQSKANPLQIQKQKEREAKILIRKLNADRRNRENIKKQRVEELKIKEKKDEEDRKKQEEKQLKLIVEEQKKRKKEIYDKIAARATSRKKIDEETTLKYQEVKAKEPMFKKIEKKYQKSVEMPALEQKKEKLEQIRNFYKPIDRQEVEEHQQKYKSTKNEKQLKIQEKRLKEINDIQEHLANMHYKPNNDPQHIQQIGIIEKKKDMEERRKQTEEQKEKIDNYGKYVREMYWPKVSVKKQLELEQIKSTLKTSPLRKSATKEEDSDDEEDIKIPGKKYLNYDRPWQLAMSKKKRDDTMERNDSYVSLNKNGLPRSPQPYSDIDRITKKSSPQITLGPKSVRQTLKKGKRQSSLIGSRQNSIGELRRINNSEITGPYAHSDINSIGHHPHTPHKSGPVDYLAEVRKKREEQLQKQKALEASSGKKAPRYLNNNEKVINAYLADKNLNEYEKLEAVKRKAHAMEERARMQEKLIQVSNKRGFQDQEDQYSANVEKTIAVNDMYIDAIQAKLKILDAI